MKFIAALIGAALAQDCLKGEDCGGVLNICGVPGYTFNTSHPEYDEEEAVTLNATLEAN